LLARQFNGKDIAYALAEKDLNDIIRKVKKYIRMVFLISKRRKRGVARKTSTAT
jgi:hypothetical protein